MASWPPSGAPIAQGEPGSPGAGLQGVVPPLAERGADRVYGRQVDDVEPHVGDRLKPARGGAQRSRDRLPAAHRVELHALGAREELVPGAVQGAQPLDEHRHPPGPGHEVPQRVLREDRGDLAAAAPPPAGPTAAGCGRGAVRTGERVAQSARAAAGRGGARRLPDRPRGPLEQQRPLGQHELDVLAARDLDARVVVPVRDRIGPRLDVEVPGALAGTVDVRAVAVRSRRELPHPAPAGRVLARRISQHHGGAEHAVALSDDGRADLEGLAGDRLGRPAPALHHGLDIEDGDASDHAVKVPPPGVDPPDDPPSYERAPPPHCPARETRWGDGLRPCDCCQEASRNPLRLGCAPTRISALHPGVIGNPYDDCP